MTTVESPADTGAVQATGPLADAYPLTALQAGMLFHSELEPGSATYHDVFTLTLRGSCDTGALASALAEVTARHSVLRTSFNLSDFAEPLQLVHVAAAVPLTQADLSGLAPDEARKHLLQWRDEEKRQPFDWAQAPLLRVFVHRLPGAEFALTLSFHHAILDGWSVATLTTELLRRYAAQLAGSPLPVAALPVSYRDFVAAERAAVAAPEAAAYWRAVTADAPVTALPRLPGAGPDGGEDTETVQAAMGEPVAARLAQVARKLRVPMRTVLLAAHLRVLALMSGEVDVTTGLVTHGRPEHEAGEQVLGLFLNSVPLRLQVDRPSWAELIRAVFDAELGMLPHRAYPLFEIQQLAGRSPLFEALFDYRDFHVYGDLPADGPVQVVAQDFFEQTNLPFAAAFARSRSRAGLTLTLTFSLGQFTRSQVTRVCGHYRHALAEIAANPQSDPRPTSGYLAGSDASLVVGWNATGVGWRGAGVLPVLVAEQAVRSAGAVALVSEAGVVSYGEFVAGVNRLARYLAGTGVAAGDVVGVLLERGPELVTAVHAVQAAGAAYLPLDPQSPPARLGYMCATAGAARVVTTAALAGLLDGPGMPAPVLLDGAAGQIAALPASPLPVTITPDALAYVIFTSGSTGQPKGVAVSHAAITNRLRWMQQALPLDAADRVAHKTPAGFDVSVWELFWPLITGAAMVIAAPGGHRDTGYLATLFAAEQVTVSHFVPSLLDAFLDEPGLAGRLPGLRQVICSGEALAPALAGRFHTVLPHAELHNLYGPTEAAVDVTWHQCQPGEDPLPIGRPVANTRIHIHDRAGQPVPVGVPGELCIAGAQLAAGYIGRPALTAAAFTPDPHGPPGSRLYHTGDLARWLPTGEIDYLGRTDQQVKIRGIRVEPGEIEAALASCPGVRAAVVHAWPHPAGPRLAAYLIAADPTTPPDPTQLPTQLATTLPAHMIPTSYHILDTLPLTPSGKLNRNALPPPTNPTPTTSSYRPPRDQVEAKLATIWEKLLGLPAVGITDDFFALGGHSLLALRLAVRIRQELGRELPVATVLAAPTIRQLAAEVRRPDDMGSASPIVPLRTTGDRPALFLSHALGGQVFRYRPLAARLGDDQPVYTIPARGLLPGEEPHDTIEQMADDYTRCIREIRPHGPYILGGFCIGGNIALEVARRLRADGEEVPLVFPTWSSADEPVVRSSLEDETMLMIHALAGGVNVLETVDLDELRGLSTDERLVAVVSAAAREQRLRPDTADLEQARRYLRVFRANAHAVGYYRHEPYDGDVVLLQPAEDPEITPGEDFGWRKVVTGRFAIAPIRGTRFTSVYEPLVADMAAQIRRWMDHGFADENAAAR